MIRLGKLGGTGLLLVSLFVSPALAQTPANPAVSAGAASISGLGSATVVVNQTSEKAIINWSSFSISAGSSVTFKQPDVSAITLNRVTGSAPTTISGSLTGNGQVWLLNPNGVLIGAGGKVAVGGLFASTHAISDVDFLTGTYNFEGSAATGAVTNQGMIIADGGYAVLAGNQVANVGLIQARLGQVALGAGGGFALDIAGDKLLSFAVTRPVAAVAAGPGLVTNTGVLSAQGGSVLLTVRAAADVVSSVINTTGLIDATAVHSEGGTIVLDGGDSGFVFAAGRLDASGKAAGQAGGTIQMLGAAVGVGSGGLLDASGSAGGGTIAIGGGWQGASINGHASAVFAGVGSSATLNASAIYNGNGGEITVWSAVANPRSVTLADGNFLANGGANGGNGGRIETSGHYLDTTGAHGSAAAPDGKAGSWLFDPYDVTIVPSANLAPIIDPELINGFPGYATYASPGALTVTATSLYDSNNSVTYRAPTGGSFAVIQGIQPANNTRALGYGELVQTFNATAGQTVNFYTLFIAHNTAVGSDFGLVSVSGPNGYAQAVKQTVASVGSYGTRPWMQSTLTLPYSGVYSLLILGQNGGGPSPYSQFAVAISADASAQGSLKSSAFGHTWKPFDIGSQIDVSQISSLLNAGTNVQITTGTTSQGVNAGNITVNAPIAKTAGGNATLELDALNGIVVNQAIGSSSGKLNVTLNAGVGGISLDSTVNTNGGTLVLNTIGTALQSSALTTAALTLQGAQGSFLLNNPGNSFSVISGKIGSGSIANASATNLAGLTTSGQLALDSAGPITVTGSNAFGASAMLSATGSITLALGAQITAAQSLALESSTDFINQAGAGAISTSNGGHWGIYSQAPVSDAFDGLASGNLASWGETPGTLSPLSLTSDRYVFAMAPTATITANNEQKTYGNTLRAADLSYMVSGLVSANQYGNVFLQDSVSGTALLNSPGAATTANVGTYAINIALGTLVAPSGYDLTTIGGTLTLSPAQLTLAAVSQTRTYDGTTVSSLAPLPIGLVNGNNISGLTQEFDSKSAGIRTLSVNSGYVINDGDGGANYMVSLRTASGTITPLALSASLTGSVSKTYDGTAAASLAAGNYALSGVLAGDSVTLNNPATGSFGGKDAGTGQLVQATGLALGGAQASDYTVNPAASAAIGTIIAMSEAVDSKVLATFAVHLANTPILEPVAPLVEPSVASVSSVASVTSVAASPSEPEPDDNDASVVVSATGPAMAGADSSVNPTPPSPVPDTAPPTPQDSEDAGDPVLALVSVADATPAPHAKRQTSVTVPIDGGLLGEETTVAQPLDRIPGVDDEFSGSGRGF